MSLFMKRRTAMSALGLAAVVTLALTGCSGGASASVTSNGSGASGTAATLGPDDKVTITFETYNLMQAGPWTDTVNQLIADFESEHPNITVKGQPPAGTVSGNNFTASVQQEMLAGDAPDVAQLTFDALDYIVNGLGVQPIEDMVGRAAVEENFGGEYPYDDRAKVLGDYDGKTYGIPYVFSTPVMFYNKTAFEEAGVEPVFDTWDDVMATATAMTKATGKPALNVACVANGGDWCMQGIIKSAGGRAVAEDHQSVVFDSPEAIAAVQEMRDLNDAGVLANVAAADTYTAFPTGQVSMQLTTAVMQSTYLAAGESAGYELGLAPMPAFPGREAVPTNSGSALFILSDDPKQQAAAWEFIKFMTSGETGATINEGFGYVPQRPGIVDGPLQEHYATYEDLIQPNLDQLEKLEPWDAYPGSNYSQIAKIFNDAVVNATFYGADVAETMKKAADDANALIN